MVSPQKENGYTAIANELLEALTKAKFNGTQFRIINAVIRYTYGFNRKSHQLSATFISKATGIGLRQITRELSTLADRNVITIYKKGNYVQANEIGINKHYDTWKDVCFDSTDKSDGSDNNVGSDKLDTTSSDRIVSTSSDKVDSTPSDKFVGQEIHIKENKKNIKKIPFQELFDLYIQQNIVKHKSLTEDMKKAIKKAVDKYSVEDIKTAITRYGEMYQDKDNKYAAEFCKYSWTLKELLTRDKGIPDFLDDGGKWIRYLKDEEGKSQKNAGSWDEYDS